MFGCCRALDSFTEGSWRLARSALPFREPLLLQTGNGFRAQFLPGGPNRHQLRAIRDAGRSFVGAYSRVHVCSSHCLRLTRPARSTHTTNRLNPIQSMNPGHPAHHRCGIDRARRQQLSWSRASVRDPASASLSIKNNRARSSRGSTCSERRPPPHIGVLSTGARDPTTLESPTDGPWRWWTLSSCSSPC